MKPTSRRYKILCFSLALCLFRTAEAKDKNPYEGTGSSGPGRASSPRSGALFTTEKKRPDKAERNAVFEDYRIPKNLRKNYVAEYRVPVSLGGSNTYNNIEALPKSHANIKHRVQKELEAKLRRKEIALDEAQFRILNWQTDPIAATVTPP